MLLFWATYDAARGGGVEERVRALRDDYFVPNLEVHRAARIGRVDLVRWIAQFDRLEPVARRLSQRLPDLWCGRLARFRHVVPDAADSVPAISFVSFMHFDAGIRLHAGRVVLFFGLDMMAQLHGEQVGPLLDHERFHLYHHEVNPSLIMPGGDPLWLGIWKEGLAIHATAVLDPALPRLAVFLGDAALAQAGPALFRRLAQELPDRLAETAPGVRARYLAFGHQSDLPARSGYALGAAIVERVAAGRGLAELARIPAAEAERLIRREVQALAQ